MSKTNIDALKESILSDIVSSVVDLQNSIEELPRVLDGALQNFSESLESAEQAFVSMKDENALLLKNQTSAAIESIKNASPTHRPKGAIKLMVVAIICSVIFGGAGLFIGTRISGSKTDLQRATLAVELLETALKILPEPEQNKVTEEFKKLAHQHYAAE